ncbi:arylsulfatase B-like [Venturia canescens]|uniref:arylsulfatase B-like n=1 Tax=Venturia canescens TaxID=32260 RepID=UPI001C9D5023|nr:arylsulfatase B-like [Venturia canescens]
MVLDSLNRTGLVVLLAIGLCLDSCHCEYDEAPHIVVFMADDLGWNDVGFHGSSQIPTPNIDALAYNGLILNRHYVLPSCTPTRAAFFTGKYPIRMGMQGEGILGGEPRGLPLNVRILPEHLRDLGYSPKLIGKWHLGFHTRQHTPLYRGFDSFFGYYNSHIAYYDYRYSQGNMSGFDLHRGDAPAYDVQGEYVTQLFTEEAEKIIDHHDPITPLYLQISHLGVHAPLEVPINNYNDHLFQHIRDDNRRKYAKMVSSLDDSLGRVVSALGFKGMLKNTIILFLTDNGAPSIGKYRNWGSNFPLRGTKYTLYEGGVRGVAAIWSPRLLGMANVSNNLIHVTDWLPTLYAAAGGNVTDLGDIDGVNHWPHFSKGKSSPRESLLLNIDELAPTEGAIHRRFKLVRGSYKQGYYDQYYGESGRNRDVPEYNYTTVHRSAVASSISAHIQGPMTQPSQMSHLRDQASVICRRSMRNVFSTCNETECLFDIVNDPCETNNIAKQYPKIVNFLDLYLEKYGNVLVKQPRLPIDWLADPRRRNNTWQPWLNSGYYEYNGATAISTLAVSAHIGMVLIIVSLRAFI